MILIIGGAYQGKLAYAKEHLGIRDEDIYRVPEQLNEVQLPLNNTSGQDVSYSVIYGLEHWIYSMAEQREDGIQHISEQLELLQDKIIICEDNSCGVVPVDAIDRAYREMAGRVLNILAQNASCVIRVFCGIGTVIKGQEPKETE